MSERGRPLASCRVQFSLCVVVAISLLFFCVCGGKCVCVCVPSSISLLLRRCASISTRVWLFVREKMGGSHTYRHIIHPKKTLHSGSFFFIFSVLAFGFCSSQREREIVCGVGVFVAVVCRYASDRWFVFTLTDDAFLFLFFSTTRKSTLDHICWDFVLCFRCEGLRTHTYTHRVKARGKGEWGHLLSFPPRKRYLERDQREGDRDRECGGVEREKKYIQHKREQKKIFL